MREALEGVMGVASSRVLGSRLGSTVRGIKVKGDHEVLGDELVIRNMPEEYPETWTIKEYHR